MSTLTCDNSSAAPERWNSRRPLTHPSDYGREGLEVNSTQQQGSLRECKACGELRPVGNFYVYRTNGKDYPAKTCTRCTTARSAEAQREIVRRRNGQSPRPKKTPGGMTIAERRAHWATHKKRAGCADCGRNDDWRILQFDHLPGFEKSFDLSWGIARPADFSDAEIAQEVAKCEVVCLHCHVRRSTERRVGPDWRTITQPTTEPQEAPRE